MLLSTMKPFHHAFRTRSSSTGLWNAPTEQQAIKLYRLSKSRQLTPQLFQTLCTHWEVSENTLWKILNRKTWKAFPLEALASQPTNESPTESTSPNP